MNQGTPDTVPCRLCKTLITREAKVCPSCGAKEPWIPDEPTLNPRVVRLVMWVGGIVLAALLLFVSGVMVFAPVEGERDHRPPSRDSSR